MTGNYLTTRSAAKMLGISLRTAQQWVETGQLRAWKTQGGHRRIARESVMAAMQKREPAVPALPYSLPVLIVEDDLSLIRLYQVRLRTWPFAVHVSTAPNGYEALVLIGEAQPALLICDLGLPGVNGFQVVRAICAMERFKNLCIVVITGLSGAEIEAHGGLPERVEVMGKPIDFERLQMIAQREWTLGAAGKSATVP